jgi:hypothetical protein
MALMIGTLYDALADAGTKPALARAAAEEVAAQRSMSPDRPWEPGRLDLQSVVRSLEIKVNILAGMNIFLLLLVLFLVAARL